MRQFIALFSIITLFFVANVKAEEDDLWTDDWEENTTNQWSGYLELGYGSRLSKDSLFDSQSTLEHFLVYLENDWDFEKHKISFKAFGSYDGALDKFKGDLRELTISFSAFENTDVKIGRQISTWGTGDLLFLNDLFPKNWDAYFNGSNDTYLKTPSNSFRITSYFDLINLDLVWTPKFAADSYINGDRFSFFSPQVGANIGGYDVINEVEPSSDELALRIYKNYKGIEYALYGYKGFDKRPLGATETFQPTHHKRNLVGASVRGNLAGGIFNLEYSYENALEDPDGSNPLVNNSLAKYLIGFESEWVPKLNVGFQLYREAIQDHSALMANSPWPQFEVSKNRDWLTNRIRYAAMQDKLTLNLFSFYSFTDKEYFLRWNINYRQDDHWNYTFGINQIDGKKYYTFFNQFKKSSNAYFRIRYNF